MSMKRSLAKYLPNNGELTLDDISEIELVDDDGDADYENFDEEGRGDRELEDDPVVKGALSEV